MSESRAGWLCLVLDGSGFDKSPRWSRADLYFLARALARFGLFATECCTKVEGWMSSGINRLMRYARLLHSRTGPYDVGAAASLVADAENRIAELPELVGPNDLSLQGIRPPQPDHDCVLGGVTTFGPAPVGSAPAALVASAVYYSNVLDIPIVDAEQAIVDGYTSALINTSLPIQRRQIMDGYRLFSAIRLLRRAAILGGTWTARLPSRHLEQQLSLLPLQRDGDCLIDLQLPK
jgi:hypothetical protein